MGKLERRNDDDDDDENLLLLLLLSPLVCCVLAHLCGSSFSSLLYQLIGFVVMMRKSLMHLMHLMHLLITFVAVFFLSSSSSHVAATCLTSTMTAGEAIDCSGEILVGEELAFKDLMG